MEFVGNFFKKKGNQMATYANAGHLAPSNKYPGKDMTTYMLELDNWHRPINFKVQILMNQTIPMVKLNFIFKPHRLG